MGDEREFKIRITTLADASGAQKTAAELDKVTASTEGAAKATEKHSVGLHAMHRLFHALNEVVPGLGVVMQAAFSPIGATISIAVLALQFFREHLKKINEELDKMGEENAKPATNRLNALRDATVSAAVGMNDLRLKLEAASRVEQDAAQITQRATGELKERAKAAETLAEATKDNELAQLDVVHAAGLDSEDEYARRRLEIEQAFQDEKRQLQENEAMREILVRRRILENAEIAQPGLEDKAAGAVLTKTKALEDLNALPDAAGVEQRKRDSEKALKDFETKYAAHLSVLQGQGPFASQYAADLHDQWVKLSGAASGALGEWQRLPGERAKRQVAADNESAGADRASQEAIANQKYISETGEDLGRRRMMFDAGHRDNQEIGRLGRDTMLQHERAGTLKSPEGQFFNDVAGAETTLRQGGQISLQQGYEIRRAAQVMNQAHIENGAAMLSALRTNSAQVIELAQKIQQFEKQIRGLAGPP